MVQRMFRKLSEGEALFVFFILVFLLTIPVYALGLFAPFSIIMTANPFIAAVVLTYHRLGRDGVYRLLKRTMDYPRITRTIWYLPILFLMPVVMVLMALLTIFNGMPFTGMKTPVLMLPVYFVVFFILAIGEETGWSGYAIDPLQARYGALPAALMIGGVWALWHLIPYALANPPIWVAGQCVTTVFLRVLMVWIYNNTGLSVFGMILFHVVINLCTVPDFGFRYDPVVAGIILAPIVVMVSVLWGSETLARFRYAKKTVV